LSLIDYKLAGHSNILIFEIFKSFLKKYSIKADDANEWAENLPKLCFLMETMAPFTAYGVCTTVYLQYGAV
jgi:hypothetical protein